MPSEPNTDRVLGEHEADIRSLKSDVHELRTDMRQVLTILSEARGGWRAMVAIGWLAGTIASALTAWVLRLLGMLSK